MAFSQVYYCIYNSISMQAIHIKGTACSLWVDIPEPCNDYDPYVALYTSLTYWAPLVQCVVYPCTHIRHG